MRSEAMVVWRSKNGLSMLLAAISSVALGVLIVKVPASYVSYLILGLASIWLMAIRPQWYVLAFWGFSVVGGSLAEGVARMELAVGGLTINPFGLLNGLLPLFYMSTCVARGSLPQRAPMRGVLLLLAMWATLSLLLGGLSPRGIRQWVTLLNWAAAYLIFCEPSLRSLKPRRIATYMAIVAVMFALTVLWSAWSGRGIPDASQQIAYGSETIYRASGFTTQPEGAGEVLAIFAVGCLAFMVRPREQKILVGIFVLLVAGIWFTHARTATLGLFAAALVVLWTSDRFNWISGLLALCAGLLLIVSNPRFDWSSALSGDFNRVVYSNAFWRMDAWKELLGQMSVRNYFFGNGIGSAWETLGGSPHNEYVAYLYDMGVVGVGFLMAMICGSIRYAAKIYRRGQGSLERGWGLACVGVVVADSIFKMVGIPLSSPSSSYSLWLTVAMVCISHSEESRGSTSRPRHPDRASDAIVKCFGDGASA